MPRLRISLTVDTTSVKKINRVTVNLFPAIKTRESPQQRRLSQYFQIKSDYTV